MKTRSILAFALFLACAGPALAESERDIDPATWALEFQVQPASGSTQYGIATKYHLSDRSAVRFGFLVSWASSDGDASTRQDWIYPSDTTWATYRWERSTDEHSGSVFLHFARYVAVRDRFGVSLDVGPLFGWRWSKATETQHAPPPSAAQSVRTFKGDETSYGVELQGGFEWHFTHRLSLAGRYGFSALRKENHQTVNIDEKDTSGSARYYRVEEIVSDGFVIQTTRSVFSLIAYW